MTNKPKKKPTKRLIILDEYSQPSRLIQCLKRKKKKKKKERSIHGANYILSFTVRPP